MLVFLFSGVCSLMIWLILIRGKNGLSKLSAKKQSYFSQILGILGVILAFINWPKFNAAGSLVSLLNVDTTAVTTNYLQSAAMTNTILSLSIAILFAYVLAEKDNGNKMKYPNFVDCFMNVKN